MTKLEDFFTLLKNPVDWMLIWNDWMLKQAHLTDIWRKVIKSVQFNNTQVKYYQAFSTPGFKQQCLKG